MPVQTESYSIHVKSKMSDVERKARIDSGKSSISCHEEDMDAFPEESGNSFWNSLLEHRTNCHMVYGMERLLI